MQPVEYPDQDLQLAIEVNGVDQNPSPLAEPPLLFFTDLYKLVVQEQLVERVETGHGKA